MIVTCGFFQKENKLKKLSARDSVLNLIDGNLFLTVSNSSNNAIFICNDDFEIVYSNKKFQDLISCKEPEGESLFEIFFTREDSRRKEVLELETGLINELQILGYIRKEKEEVVRINMILSSIEGNKNSDFRFMGIIEDITDICNMEQELIHIHKQQTVGHISGGIIHDFNNTLMGIMGCAELIMNHSNDELLLEYAGKLVKMSQRASELNTSMLNYIKKGTGVLRVCDLHKIIDEALSLTVPMLGSSYMKNTDFRACHSIVHCDPVLIENVLINLLVNAKDAMYHSGKITITTENKEIQKSDEYNPKEFNIPGKYIMIKISDTGVGIEEENLEKIFEPYYTTKSQNKGTGLGLYIVKRIVGIHGGQITVKTQKGTGTDFIIYLPLYEGIYEEKNEKNIKPDMKKDLKVMLIDDESIIREIVEELITNLGYQVVSFSSASEAIPYYRSNYKNIDIVLLDMVMPAMTGIEVFEVFKSLNPTIKAALFSGFNFEDEEKEILNKGIKAILGKPINRDELAVKLSELSV